MINFTKIVEFDGDVSLLNIFWLWSVGVLKGRRALLEDFSNVADFIEDEEEHKEWFTYWWREGGKKIK